MALARSIAAAAAAILLTACSSTGTTDASASPGIAFVNVAVVPMDEARTLSGQTVLIEGDRITRIGPAGEVRIPRGYRRIDGEGRYLMPGIVDFHIHLRSPGELPSYLAYGVTTVAQMSGGFPEAPDILGYRARIAAGEMIGPTIYATGPLVDAAPLLPHTRRLGVGVATVAEANEVVAAQRAAGYDMVKIYQMLSPELYDAVVAAALEQGITPVGHVPQRVDLDHAIEQGQAMIVHGAFFGEAVINEDETSFDLSRLPALIALAREHDVAVTPTLMAEIAYGWRSPQDAERIFSDPEMRFQHPETVRGWRDAFANTYSYGRSPELSVPFNLQLLPALHAAGVLIVMGTDEGAEPGLFPGRSAHDELAAYVRAGLSNFDALATATRNPGVFVQRRIDASARFGQVAVGYRADLLLLGADPLRDIGAASTPIGVMTRGRWFEAAEIAALREAAIVQYGLGEAAP